MVGFLRVEIKYCPTSTDANLTARSAAEGAVSVGSKVAWLPFGSFLHHGLA